MSNFIIRDIDTGKVVLTDNDLVSRYLGTVVLPVNFEGTLTYVNGGFKQGTPYYIYDGNGNFFGLNADTWGQTIGHMFGVLCAFSGETATISVSAIRGNINQNGVRPSYIHFGVY